MASEPLRELRQQLGRLTAQMREMLAAIEQEKRDFSAEERNRWDALNADVDTIEARIANEERVAELEARGRTPVTDRIIDDLSSQRTEDTSGHRMYRVLRGTGGLGFSEQPGTPETAREQRAFGGFLRGNQSGTYELRALQADNDPSGGYTVMVQQFVARLIQAVDNAVMVRRYATVIPVMSADSLGVPTLDADPDDADWTGEISPVQEDASMRFGKRELHPHPVSKQIKISKKLLRVSALDVEALVMDRLAYKFAVTEEKGFMTGSGANQPLGVFTASAQGISTARDVSSGNTSTAIGADGLINALYSLKEGYQSRARWVFHRDAIKQIRSIKDGNGVYLWQPGLAGGQPSTILDKPFAMSEYVPNTFTSGLYVGLIGDLSYYWIADALSMQVQHLVELYATTNQDGFIGRLECDGMPVLEEAFARVKLG